MKKGNCLIAQSGGPTAAINASLAGVFSGAKKSVVIDMIYGGMNGVEGIMEGKLVDLSPILNDKNLKLLKTTPSSFLGSCRYKIKGNDDFKRLFEIFRQYNIKFFFYIGGNDSMDTILQLKKYQEKNGGDIMFVGVPKTIDNDLTCIDHTPGFGSAAKYIATTVKEIAFDTAVYDKESVVIIEVMGRNTGWLALSASLAGYMDGSPCADLIYMPENAFNYDKLVKDLNKVLEQKKQAVIVVSEGIKNAEGKFIAEASVKDNFGHAKLGGASKHVEVELKERIPGLKLRSVEINVLQRCAAHLLSARDINESFMMGQKAVEIAAEGKSGVMVSSYRKEEGNYSLVISSSEIELIANQEKIVPEDYMNEEKNQASAKGHSYLLPLIQGEIYPEIENGIPKYLVLQDFLEQII